RLPLKYSHIHTYKKAMGTKLSTIKLSSLDMIAIPDFAAGVMENYGLVTYRETALLYDKQHSTAANKQRVAIVVAHELAHQWFRDLVTMEWWTHLWVNEGFATWVFLTYLAVDSLFPEWKIWTQFLAQTTDGLRLDGLAESHPIEVDINHASEIDEIFDAISYRKVPLLSGCYKDISVLNISRSLASYINKFACSNARIDDVWAALEEGSGEPVNMLMNSLTKQIGYPVISVKLKDNKLEFDQSQFLQSGSSGNGQWIVLITLCCDSYEAHKKFLLRSKSESLDVVKLLGSSDVKGNHKQWIKLNVDQESFYRVKYDDDLQARLRYVIEASSLSATDRFDLECLTILGHDLTLNEVVRRFRAFVDDKNTPLLPPDSIKLMATILFKPYVGNSLYCVIGYNALDKKTTTDVYEASMGFIAEVVLLSYVISFFGFLISSLTLSIIFPARLSVPRRGRLDESP
ncbi:hypothetical protein MKX01_029452, partial [Papaver californicum]